MNRDKTGKKLLTGVAVFTSVGGFLFDWNKTHLFNPNWPPHAKFHDAMTITLGSLLGLSGLYLLQKKSANKTANLQYGTLLPVFFWMSQASSFAFPGAKGLEAEFPEKVPQIGPVRLNEGAVSIVMLALLGLGYALTKKKQG